MVLRSFIIRQPEENSPQCGFPAPDPGHKKFNSRLVAPTIFSEKPFGDYVEGLFHCEDASYGSTNVLSRLRTMVEITRKSDGTPLFVRRNVVQIPSSVLRRQPCELPTRLNEQWAMDFTHESPADGTTFRES